MTPKTQKSVWIGKTDRIIKDLPVPSPEKGEVLIKNVAVASNPKDWKLPYYIPDYAAVEGNDVAGYVEQVGEGVTKFKVGDKVAAFTKMRGGDRTGAYQQYSIAPSHTTFHLGLETSFEDGSTLTLAYMTAVVGVYQRLGLPQPGQKKEGSKKEGLLIWGGATTVGYFAIQLAKVRCIDSWVSCWRTDGGRDVDTSTSICQMSGLYVVAVAGSSAPLLSSLGVDEILDYRNKSHEDLVSEIRKAYDGQLHYAFDVVSENGTLEAIAEAFQGRSGAKATYTLTYDNKVLDEIKEKGVETVRTLVGTAHGGDSEALAEEYFDKVGRWVEEGSFKPMKVTIVPGGLGGVKEGLRRLQEGEVRGEKLVYRINETEGL
ncbi:BZ3500_MvSof-1268-A1-R1_Chr1-2g01379 [Microbotryum saponariae]|uniref:BZ3500_MvSof-1268-A1-R1_Chr1-2g01379 protein n=1 Tax=Microbotryum saponariae TaxID=289078 RepID=A0A2X0L6J5_9BASI|nr:BZ3500_MvSof-1268-A1-R1_Chr1-2g01379 [Microbotryum saponariae]SCZ97256.1 BZ3501_MvSof-1269-A2-R1_Chr1-2g00978 [Microbotryum saponariae]